MPIRGRAFTLVYEAFNTNTNTVQINDQANHTLQWWKDGVINPTTNSPTQINATTFKGLYQITLTKLETLADVGVLGGVSATANVLIRPVAVIFDNNLRGAY